MSKFKVLFSLAVIFFMVCAIAGVAPAKDSAKIVHDAEYYILEAQHGEKWATEDKVIDQKLAELRKKYGRPKARKRFQFSKR